MGYRTVVVLYNDFQHEWSKDPELGQKIARAASYAMGNGQNTRTEMNFGRVVQNCHVDEETLAIFDSYSMIPLAAGRWNQTQTYEEMSLKLLKDAAENMGYRLVKKPVVVSG
jgi:hypothetical protein